MPYIKPIDRPDIDSPVSILSIHLKTWGELNYAITQVVHNFVLDKEDFHGEDINYEMLAMAAMTFEMAKAEFIRTVVNPYEQKKREENGHISDLDCGFNMENEV